MSEVLKKFGRYFLLDQVGQGGMAEIFRARSSQSEGVARILVIKRIQSSYVESKEYADMFRTEINVMLGLQHPNIIQLHDSGIENDQPYIAMEYVEGRNIRQFLTRLAQSDRMFPVLLAAYIAEQSASALHYAHHFRDRVSGNELNIVHRDISPQNILISYDGTVKVIDFGIAKASVNSEVTKVGVIKGKPSYLSPEQIAGEPLDGRSDIFALGIVLWELLTRKKLFAAENELAAIKLIESCNTHVKLPSTINKDVPHELDMIVIKALARNKDKRYQTGEELQRALHKFIYTVNSDFSASSDMSQFAKELFKKELVEDRKELQRLNEKAEQLMQKQISNNVIAPSLLTTGQKPEDTTTFVEMKKVPLPVQAQRVTVELPSDYIRQKVPMDPSPALKNNGGKSWQPQNRPSNNSKSKTQMIASQKKGGSNVTPFLVAAAAIVGVVLYGPQFGVTIPGIHSVKSTSQPDTTRTLAGQTNTSPTSSVASPMPLVKAVEPEKVLLNLAVRPSGSNYQGVIKVQGKSDVVVDPVSSVVWVPMDTPLIIQISKPGYPPYQRELSVSSKSFAANTRDRRFPVEVNLDPGKVGYLSLVTTPSSEAIILINGKTSRIKTPFERAQVPAGTYDIRLRNDLLGMEKTITITIREGQSLQLEETLPIKDSLSSSNK